LTSADSKLLRVAFGVVSRAKIGQGATATTKLSKYAGNIRAYYKKFAADGSLTYVPLVSHECTEAELKANFYSADYKDNAKILTKIQGHM